jgi:type I restriction enzyme S subunit
MEKLLPQLRFPEFKEEWEEKKLGTVFSIFNGYAFPSKASEIEGVIWVKIADVGIQEMKYKNLSFLPSSYLATHKKFVLKKGDYVVALTRPILNGKLKIAQINDFFDGALLNQRVGKIYSKNSHAFVFSLLQRDELIKSIENSIAGSDPPNLSPNEINPILVHIPHLPEQTKIASFLTAVDAKLTALKQKKTLLEQYKKGVMQQIFSQELRFKDDNGNDYADWEEKNGNFIFESISDKKHNSDLPILAITQEFGAIPRDLIDYKVSVTDKSVDSYKVVQVGDFIISLRSFQGGIEYSNFKGICSPAYIILRPHVQINDLFFKTYFKTESYIFELQKNLEGIRDGKMISFKYFSEIKLPLPSIPEQTKIANFLVAIDEKINHCQAQIEKATIWKKGLLQQLFV